MSPAHPHEAAHARRFERWTFTLTNAGQYGTMMQFPIINQPQVAILSTDGVKRKPVVVTDEFGNESIAIHSVGVLALAWDHRAFDGACRGVPQPDSEILETRDWEGDPLIERPRSRA